MDLRRYNHMINEETKRDVLPRLRKIEGQIRGIQRMVEKEKYCIDIINQLTAAERALEQASLQVVGAILKAV